MNTFSKIKTNGSLAVAILCMLLFATEAQARSTSTDQLPSPLAVTNSTAELQQLGCTVTTATDGIVDVPNDVTYLVQPADAVENQYVFCPQEIVPKLVQKSGQVAGLTSEAQAQEEEEDQAGCFDLFNSLQDADVEVGTVWDGFVGCLANPFVGGAVGTASGVQAGAKWATSKVVGALTWIVIGFATIGGWILWAGTALVNFGLSPTRFATHEIVTTGWPIIQGVANLGFIAALLAIAFGTTLRLDKFDARRMLPRLLFAALLINFSLLIGTLLVDGSRLFMAIELGVLNAGAGNVTEITELGNEILRRSQLTKVTAQAIAGLPEFLSPVEFGLAGRPADGWTLLMMTAFSALMIWGTAIGFIIIGVMLLVRYLAILLLLVFSPLAFLAIALPGADNLAKRWWSEFIKYVLYGPAVLFLLILLIKAQDVPDFFGRNIGDDNNAYWFSLIGSVMLTIVMLYIAATVGRYLGMAGAGATIGFVSGKAKQAARLYGGGLALAGGAAAGTGLKLAERRVSKTGFAKSPLGQALGQVYKGTKEVTGNAAQKQFGIAGKAFIKGGELSGKGTAMVADYRSNLKEAKQARSVEPTTTLTERELQTHGDLTATNLAKGNFVANLAPSVVTDLMDRGSVAQKAGLAAGLNSAKDIPDMEVYLQEVTNNAFDITTLMQQEINKAQRVLDDPAASAARKNAARQLFDESTKTLKSNNSIMRSMANNETLVDKMSELQRSRFVEFDDEKTNESILRSLKNLRDKKDKKS